MPGYIRLGGLAAIIGLALTAPAFAHAHIKTAYPAADCVNTTAPTEVDITFTEDVNLKFTGVTLTGPGKKDVALGDGMLMGGDAMFMAPISAPLAPGDYTVTWHALSSDGHKTNGTYTFTVK